MFSWFHRVPLPAWYAASGLLMGCAFLHPLLWWAVFPGLVLLLWCLRHTKSPKRAFFLGWLAGTVKMLVVLFFVWSVYPLTWLGIDSQTVQVVLIGSYWVFVSVVTGLGYGIGGFLFTYLRSSRPIAYVLFFPLILLGGEVLGAMLHALSVIGPGSSITAAFSVGHTGYTLIEHDLLKLAARYGGVYLLTLVAGTLSVLLFLALLRTKVGHVQWRRTIAALCVLIIIAGPVLLPSDNQQNKETYTVAIFTTRFDSNVLYSEEYLIQLSKRKLVVEALEEALKRDIAAVVLPETTRVSELYDDDHEMFEFLRSHSAKDLVLIDSVRAVEEDTTVSRAKIYDTRANDTYIYDKQYLVALGEYIPSIFSPLLSIADPSEKTKRIVETIALGSGIDQRTAKLPQYVPNVLFCYEGFAPWRAHDLVERNGPEYLAYTASHAWFKNWPRVFFWNQTRAALKAQALWSGVHIVQAANMAPSAHYKPDGTMGELTPIYQNSHVRVDVVEVPK